MHTVIAYSNVCALSARWEHQELINPIIFRGTPHLSLLAATHTQSACPNSLAHTAGREHPMPGSKRWPHICCGGPRHCGMQARAQVGAIHKNMFKKRPRSINQLLPNQCISSSLIHLLFKDSLFTQPLAEIGYEDVHARVCVSVNCVHLAISSHRSAFHCALWSSIGCVVASCYDEW